MSDKQRIVVIGNGIAGFSACSAIREINQDIPITIISDERFPLYSTPVLINFIGGEISRSRMFLKRLNDYKNLKISTIFGQQVKGIDCDRRQVFLDSKRVDFDMLIVATGSRAVVPPIKGVELPGVFTFKTLADADDIIKHRPKKAVVAGGGPMGIEAAIALKKRGAQVILVATRWLLPRVLDEKAGNLVQKIMEKNGVEIITWERVKSIEGNGKVERVITEKNSISCDTLIVAAGVRPNVELAREVCIKIGDLGGILVDDKMATSIDGIYACGDCIETYDAVTGVNALNLLWINARQQGRLVGINSQGYEKKYPGSINIRALNIFGVTAASFGYTADSLKGKGIEIVEKSDGKNYYCLLFSEGKLVGGQWIGRVRDTGIMMALMRKHSPLVELAGMVEHRKLPYLVPLWLKASEYIPQHFLKTFSR